MSPRRGLSLIFAVSLMIGLGGCSGRSDPTYGRAATRPAHSHSPQSAWAGASAKPVQSYPGRTAGTYKIGSPYSIRGRWYFPAEDPHYDRSGTASWYGQDFHGKRTANGEIYNMRALTAAHPTLPLPSLVYVTSHASGRTILVRVNDRGPYVHGRLIDLSMGAAWALGLQSSGVGHVRVRYAGRAPLDGNDSAERRFLQSQPWFGGGRMSLGASWD